MRRTLRTTNRPPRRLSVKSPFVPTEPVREQRVLATTLLGPVPSPSPGSLWETEVSSAQRGRMGGCCGFKPWFYLECVSRTHCLFLSYPFPAIRIAIPASLCRRKELRKSTHFLLKERKSRETNCYLVKPNRILAFPVSLSQFPGLVAHVPPPKAHILGLSS